MDEFDFDARYKVEGWSGIAWHVVSYAVESDVTIVEIDDDTWYEEYQEYEDKSRVVCVMVGDDREFTFEVYELTKLEEGDYCPECGQIGCKAYQL